MLPAVLPAPPIDHRSTFPALSRRTRTALLFVIALVAMAFRLQGLSVRGFSEDEAAKLRAIGAYRQGDFSANAEHPMLMKLAMWGSVSASDRWNAQAPASLAVAPETALRLPNAAAGAATSIAVYGATALLLEPTTGLVAAFFVATDPTIISLNRLGKEDTFLVLFFVLAEFWYERAKRIWTHDPASANRSYNAAGACFGLMLASKYLPHLLGLHCLFNMAAVKDAGENKPRLRQYFAAMGAAFLAANFAIALPGTWHEIAQYVTGHRQPHHGYAYNGHLYVNVASVLLWGVPWTYYLRMIVTKMPLPVVAAALSCLPLLVTRRRARGFIWLRVFLFVQLLGYSVIASKFQRYALPLFLVLDILAAVGVIAGLRGIWRQATLTPVVRIAACGALMAAMMLFTLRAPLSATPHFSLYQNALGARVAPAAGVYPEESYDYGVREAVGEICGAAGAHAVIVSDAENVVDYYVRRQPCGHLESRSLSGEGLLTHGEQWVLVQDNHLSFENAALVAELRAQRHPWREYRLRGSPVLQVFRVRF
jgi:4-amino-4-deoxy-L-arabinose transferase-like glycosyltransferase